MRRKARLSRARRQKSTILSSLESRPAAVEIALKRFDVGDDLVSGFERELGCFEPLVEAFYTVILQVQIVNPVAGKKVTSNTRHSARERDLHSAERSAQ